MNLNYLDTYINEPNEYFTVFLLYLIIFTTVYLFASGIFYSGIKEKKLTLDIVVVLIITMIIFAVHVKINNNTKLIRLNSDLETFMSSNITNKIKDDLESIGSISKESFNKDVLKTLDKVYNTNVFSEISIKTSGDADGLILTKLNSYILITKLTDKLIDDTIDEHVITFIKLVDAFNDTDEHYKKYAELSKSEKIKYIRSLQEKYPKLVNVINNIN